MKKLFLFSAGLISTPIIAMENTSKMSDIVLLATSQCKGMEHIIPGAAYYIIEGTEKEILRGIIPMNAKCATFYTATGNAITKVTKEKLEEIDHRKLQVCRRLEKLSLDASSIEYRELIKELHRHDLTVCTCMRDYILAQEKKDAQKVIEQELNVGSEFWKNTDELFKLSKNRQIQNVKIDQNLSDIIDSKLLKETSNYANIKASIHCVLEKSIFGTWAEVDSDLEAPYITLKIGDLMQQLSKEGQRGVWLHELYHIKDMHAEKTEMLKHVITKCSLINLAKCHENEADRIPAACGNIYDAKCIEATMRELSVDDTIYHKLRRLVRWYVAETHTSIKERLLWARRIRKLKEAEHQIIEQKKIKQRNLIDIFYSTANQF